MASLLGNNSSVGPVESPEPSPVLAVMGMLAFFSVLGTAGNSMVLFVYIRKRNKLASTMFIITLAGTDFMTCLIIIPYTIAFEYWKRFLKYDIACKLYLFFITSNVPFSAFIMVAVAFDRYLCICHPFVHWLNAKRSKLIISFFALLAFSFGVITSLNYGVYAFIPHDMYRNWDNPLNFNGANFTGNLSQLIPLSESSLFQNGDYDASFIFAFMNASANLSSNTFAGNDISGDSPPYGEYQYSGVCDPNEIFFSRMFTVTYQKVYASFFLLALITVMVLYCTIYRSVFIRRARRRRQRRSARSVSFNRDSSLTETRTSYANGSVRTEITTKSHCNEVIRQLTIREKGVVANIRTAAMLFVVTAVFIISFLPAWLMAHGVVKYNAVVFYMYFLYNVANPIIYAFMNKAFRRDMRDVLDCKKMLYNIT